MKKLLIVFILFSTVSFSLKEKPAYHLFDRKGKAADYNRMVKELGEADVVLFGEIHNNPLCHWLERDVLLALYQKKGKALVLGAEMLEADDQIIINEYLRKQIEYRHFQKEAKLWDNFDADYKPLLDFARAEGLNFVATNVPRRYASMVARRGFGILDSVDTEAKKWIAPQPIDFDPSLPGYKMLAEGSMSGHAGFMAEAQALKDATMAYFILKNRAQGKLFLHFNGSFHSENNEGIYWYLHKKEPSLKIVTIASVVQSEIENLNKENQEKADYILCFPESLTPEH